MTTDAAGSRVLVMGYRQGLCLALEEMGIAYAIWCEKKPKSRRDCVGLYLGKFPRLDENIVEVLDGLEQFGPFSHVIAGSEASVYPAAVARRHLQARKSTKTLALRCNDKLEMKTWLRELEIPMTDFIAADEIDDADAAAARLGLPLVVKQRRESGGRGISMLQSAAELAPLARRNRIVEKYIDAPEASVESFINRGNIQFESVTRYQQKKHVNLVPGDLPQAQQEALLALNRRVIKALKIQWGITHMEAYLDDDKLLFGEIALRPPGGYIMELISRAYGFSTWKALVHMELDLPFDFNQKSQRHAAVFIIHPGAGRVASISGWEDVTSHASVYRARLKLKPGMFVEERIGVGEDAGYLLCEGDSTDSLLESLAWLQQRLKIRLE